jgi:hypothetical protein
MENEIIYSEYNVTCRTENCGNSGFTIEVSAPDENPVVVCGVCANKITEVIRLTEEEIASL